ncbi:MAG: alpha/beta hydrolase [Bacteroidota bacterium]
MLNIQIFTFLVQLLWVLNSAQQPEQAPAGPGGSDYTFGEVLISDYSTEPDGFWLYEPIAPRPDSAHLVVLIHGYGAINPMIYGGWIKHLVGKGNIVVFPRYQKNLTNPAPSDFPKNVAQAIKDALTVLAEEDHVKPYPGKMSLAGHSYGGVIAANLGVNYDTLGLPTPDAIMLCSPGSGPFKGAVLDDYTGLSPDLKLLVMVSDRDHVVGDRFGKKVFNTATQVRQRNLIRQFSDRHGEPRIAAGHNECQSWDEQFDGGIYNFTSNKARKTVRTDALDYYGYWKLFDALMDCGHSGENCHVALGGTPEQKSLGQWSDGVEIRALEIQLPEHGDN